jgi:hypothetical protein
MTGWLIGYAIGAAVVVVVVALLVTMIVLARSVNAKAAGIVGALHTSRDHTRALWGVTATNAAADRILASAAQARQHLPGPGEQP